MILNVMIIWIILAIILLIMVSSIIACLCGCCRKTPRDELMGLSGKVKITNPDLLQHNNTPLALSITRTVSDDNLSPSLSSSNISAKRMSNITNNNCHIGTVTRSLPEIPVDAVKSNSVVEQVSEISNFVGYNATDNNSNLYATLEEHKTSSSRTTKPKLSDNLLGSSSQSNGTVTYEQIDEDPGYNKIKEHPYAQVENDTDETAVASTSRLEHEAIDLALPREENNLIDIPAASAITGNVAASNDLPYMTPPLHTNFSGDSQDSTKGYTSITVREPLARIRPQNKPNQNPSDSYYTVLSDDSDEMYAAIQDAYTSGSETYAQIQLPITPTTATGSFNISTSVANVTQKLAQVSVHSRQASTSSIASCLTNRNSPKEKRQANSPLPKPPDITPDEMYAKVLKKRKYESDRCSKESALNAEFDPTPSSSINFHPLPVAKDETNEDDEKKTADDGIDEVDGISSIGGYEVLPERNYEMLTEVNQCPGYETVKEPRNSGYESLPEPDSLTPGYERIGCPGGYEKIKYKNDEDEMTSEPNYEELRPRKERNNFHCYATIGKKKSSSSTNLPEPDYASLTRRENEYDSWNNGDPFYERIRKQCDDDEDADDVDSEPREKHTKYNDKNNNHSHNLVNPSLASVSNHSISESNLSDLYSKVNKNKR